MVCGPAAPRPWVLERVRALISHVVGVQEPSSRVGIVATDFDQGSRAIFRFDAGSGDRLADAVVASCSVPGLFPPISIDGQRYVDGGISSATNADLLAGTGVDTAYVVAPLAVSSTDRACSPLTRAERWFRRVRSRRLSYEVEALREAGISTTVLAPCADDLAGIGFNVMNMTRRVPVLDTAIRTTAWQLQFGDGQ